MKQPTALDEKKLTLKHCACCGEGSHIYEVPDWDTRLKTLKVIISLLPDGRKQAILEQLAIPDTVIAARLSEAAEHVNRSAIREGSRRMRWSILKRDNFTCQYCGRKAPEVELHVDHKKSIVEGGDNSEANLITACAECNRGKGASSV